MITKTFKQCLRDNDDQPSYVPFATNHIDALNEVAETIFEQVTWQHFSSYQPDVANDMEDQPDAYPHASAKINSDNYRSLKKRSKQLS